MKNLSKLLTNHQASFQVLQKLGFYKVNNRLLFECDVSSNNNIIEKIDASFFESNKNISLKFKSFVRNICKNINECNNENKNIDTTVNELIDQLPESVMQDIADDIDSYVQKNDFQSLVKFLQQKTVEYDNNSNRAINLSRDNLTNYNCKDMILREDNSDKNIDTIVSELIDHLPDSILDEINHDINMYTEKNDLGSLAKFLRKKKVEYKRKNIKLMYGDINLNNPYDVGIDDWKDVESLMPILQLMGNKSCIIKWVVEARLYDLKFPKIVIEGIIKTLMDIEINFADANDIDLFNKICQDYLFSLSIAQSKIYQKMKFNAVVRKHIDKISMKTKFKENLLMLYDRVIDHCHGNITCGFYFVNNKYRLFMQDADELATKWIAYESTCKKICKSLLNSQSTWECFQCNMKNKHNDNRCISCNQGINPFMFAKQNKSDTFCVSKPFGLIQWKSNATEVSIKVF